MTKLVIACGHNRTRACMLAEACSDRFRSEFCAERSVQHIESDHAQTARIAYLWPPTASAHTHRSCAFASVLMCRNTPCPGTANAPNCTPELVYAELQNRWLIFPQSEIPHYSNLGISILGNCLEIAAGVPYAEYITENILEPLGMEATFSCNESVIERMAVGVTVNSQDQYEPASVICGGFDQPAGGLIASSADVSKYVGAYALRARRSWNADLSAVPFWESWRESSARRFIN